MFRECFKFDRASESLITTEILQVFLHGIEFLINCLSPRLKTSVFFNEKIEYLPKRKGSSNLKDIKEYCANNRITYLTTVDFLYYAPIGKQVEKSLLIRQ